MYKSREQAREYANQYYQDHREVILAKQKVRIKKQYEDNPAYFNDRVDKRRQMLRDLIQQQKVGRICRQCGIADPRVLDFHHLDKNGKEGTIGQLASKNWSIKRILAEIAKCEVLCSNCHRILHWEERNGV